MDQPQEEGGEEGGDATEDVPFGTWCRSLLLLLFLQSEDFITNASPWFFVRPGHVVLITCILRMWLC